MNILIQLLSLGMMCIACQPIGPKENQTSSVVQNPSASQKIPLKVSESSSYSSDSTIFSRFSPPEGFQRTPVDSPSFAHYLRHFPLYEPLHPVHLFNGSLKGNQSAHVAVMNIDVGKRDLQQCADAIMRLWAEYNYEQKKYSAIQFHFVSGFLADYSTWRTGHSISVSGNRVNWVPSSRSDGSYASFRKYLNMVFSYAGTLSFAKELTPQNLTSLQIGDVFIQGGSPGHAVLVVDVAIHPQTGDKAFLLAQSYMPAQEIHVLQNPKNGRNDPWYKVSEIGEKLRTPEWTFYASDLKSIDL